MFTSGPQSHWLFLAEIVEFDTIFRLHLETKDVDDKRLPIFFYTEGDGKELKPSLVQTGHTIVILYAEFHAFAFGKPGIRVEEPANVKVLLKSSLSPLAGHKFDSSNNM